MASFSSRWLRPEPKLTKDLHGLLLGSSLHQQQELYLSIYHYSALSPVACGSGFIFALSEGAYPIFAATGLAVSMCCFQLCRNLFTNPEVRVTKDNRTAGILENFEEGEKYAQHSLRKFVRNKSPEIMPSVNKFFTESK